MLSEHDYDTINVHKMYKVKIRDCSNDEIKTVIEDGSELMEEENGGFDVLEYCIHDVEQILSKGVK